MKKRKRARAAFLACCIAAGALFGGARVNKVKAEILRDGDYRYEVLSDGTAEIKKY